MAHIGIELTLLPVHQKKGNTTFILRILKLRFRLVHRLIPVLLLDSLGIGKRCFGSRNNSTISNPFAYGFFDSTRNQQGVLRVTRRLFGYCRKVAAARYVLSYSKRFGLLPKPLPPGCLSEVGQPVLTYGVLVLFLVLYTVHSYLVVQRGTPDAEQCRSQRAVTPCLFQRMDDLFLLHIIQCQ